MMALSNRDLLVLTLFSIVTCSVGAQVCTKLVTIDGSPAPGDQVISKGVYYVKTTLASNSVEIQELATNLLKNISTVEFKRKSFIGILQPKHIKQLCKDERIKFIRQLERSQNEIVCDKLYKGQNNSAIPDSYIIIAKDETESTASISSAQIASEDDDSSVMIASVKPFHAKRRGFVVKMNEEAVDYMCHHPMVDYIEEDQEIAVASTQWHLDRIDQKKLPLNDIYSAPNNGSDVDIYIFDTGIKYDHSEFDNGRAVYSGYDPVDVLRNQNRRGEDCQGHGTHVAGLAGGATHGVARGATLHSVRVLDCSGYGSISMIVLGLNHVTNLVRQQKPSKKTRAIINMSLTTRSGLFSRVMRDSITAAVDTGILVVAAAGNYYSDACKYSPASYPDVLTVGGTQQNDKLYSTLFYATNYGPCVDIFAPGQQIQSAGISGDHSYATYDGTSQATPIVSGAAAIYWNMLSDSANATQVKEVLLDTCNKGKLDVAGFVPSSYVQQTTNCLLYIKSPPQKIFYNVKIEDVEKLIETMEKQRYAMSYMQSYDNVNNSIRFNIIFNDMGNRKFKTVAFILGKEVKLIDDTVRPKGFKITFIYSVKVHSIGRYIVVFSKTKYNYNAYFKIDSEKQLQAHSKETVQGMTLNSISAVINYKNNIPLYTTLYSNQSSVTTNNFYWTGIRTLARRIESQFEQGYYLKHLTSFMINGKEKHSLVFHQQTRPANRYHNMYGVMPREVEATTAKLIAEGQTINVVARIKHSQNDIWYIITYES